MSIEIAFSKEAWQHIIYCLEMDKQAMDADGVPEDSIEYQRTEQIQHVIITAVSDEDEDVCPLCGDDCELLPVDCCDCLRRDCEVAQDDEVRVCAVLSNVTPCEHHDFYSHII